MGLWDKMKSGVKSLGTSIKESDEVRLQRKKSERADLDRKLAVRRELREEDWQVKQRKQELRSYSPVTRAARKGKKIVKQGLRTTGAIAGKAARRLGENIRSNQGHGGVYGDGFGDVSRLGFTVYDTSKKEKKKKTTTKRRRYYEPRRRYYDERYERDRYERDYPRYTPRKRKKASKPKKPEYLF